MFDSNKIRTACYNVLRYRESRPFNNPEFFISYSGVTNFAETKS